MTVRVCAVVCALLLFAGHVAALCPQINIDGTVDPASQTGVCVDANPGDVCQLSCNAGLGYPDGSLSQQYTCLDDDTWQSASGVGDSCFSCPTLTIPADVNIATTTGTCDSAVPTQVCTFHCDNHYLFQVSNDNSYTRTCQADGTWDGSESDLVCLANSCGPLPLPNLNTQSNCSSFFVGDSCEYFCDVGYTFPDGSLTSSRSCDVGQTWANSDADYACEIVTCGIPTSDGFASPFNCTDFDNYQSECLVQCPDGYDVSGVSSITCRADGEWSHDIKCIDHNACSSNPCDLTRSTCTDVPAAEHTGINNFNPDHICTCRGGYLPYNGNPGSDGLGCTLTCGNITTTGPVIISNCTNTTLLNSRCSFSCPDGYVTSGATSATCRASSTWSASAKCIDFDACTLKRCDSQASLCKDVPAAGHTGTNAGKPLYTCYCRDGFSGTPNVDGLGCVRPTITAAANRGMDVLVGETLDITFQSGEGLAAKTISVMDILNTLVLLNYETASDLHTVTMSVAEFSTASDSNVTALRGGVTQKTVYANAVDIGTNAADIAGNGASLTTHGANYGASSTLTASVSSSLATQSALTTSTRAAISQRVESEIIRAKGVESTLTATIQRQSSVAVVNEASISVNYETANAAHGTLSSSHATLSTASAAFDATIPSKITAAVAVETTRATTEEGTASANANDVLNALNAEITRATTRDQLISNAVLNNYYTTTYVDTQITSSLSSRERASVDCLRVPTSTWSYSTSSCGNPYTYAGYLAELAGTLVYPTANSNYELAGWSISSTFGVYANPAANFAVANGRFTAPETGYYAFYTNVQTTSTCSTNYRLTIGIGGVVDPVNGATCLQYQTPLCGNSFSFNVGGIFQLTAGQYVSSFMSAGGAGFNMNSEGGVSGVRLPNFANGFSAVITGSISVTATGWRKISSNWITTAGSGSAGKLFSVGTGFTPSTGVYTVPRNGFYLVNCNIRLDAAGLRGTGYYHRVLVSIRDSLDTNNQLNAITGHTSAISSTITFGGVIRLRAGDTVSLYVQSTVDAAYTVEGQSSWSMIEMPTTDREDQYGFTAQKDYSVTYATGNYLIQNWRAATKNLGGAPSPLFSNGGFNIDTGRYIVRRAGIYSVFANTNLLSATGEFRLHVSINGQPTTYDDGLVSWTYSTSDFYNAPINLGGFIELLPGDTVELYMFSQSDASYTLNVETFFSVFMIIPLNP